MAEQVPQFKDGDRVCFIGDSITHTGSYHSNVYLYYLTRFPNREFRIFNVGISGNTTSNVLERFKNDIEVKKPTVSIVMLGMNDVGSYIYGKSKVGAQYDKIKQRVLNEYYDNMSTLLAELKSLNNNIILITPSIYDQTANIKKLNLLGKNDALGKCADFIKKTVASDGKGYVDFYDSMKKINKKLQVADKTATIIGPDRVHPGTDPGHFIMGYQFLKAQGVPKHVSNMVLDAKTGTVIKAKNSTLTAVKSTGGMISFSAHEKALPFPQTKSMSKGLTLVPFTQEMNQETHPLN